MDDVQHVPELNGLPTHDFPPPDSTAALPAAGSVAWRLSVDPYGDGQEEFEDHWRRFTETVDLGAVRALIVGVWGEAYDAKSDVVIDLILAAKDRLSALEALFIGDQEQEENEISWIEQSDVTPLLQAFPGLRVLGIRGGSELAFPAVRHTALRELRIETGGLPREVVQGIAASELPGLERLELWLGDPNYGGDTEVADLAPLLDGRALPVLRHLGLQNSPVQDEIAAAVAAAPVVAGLSSLSLSMGVLTDAGAEALLSGQPLGHLKRLDLHHHFLSDAMMHRLADALPGVEVDVSGQEEPEEYRGEVWRYVAVAE
jgi:hypothetical protein